MPAIARLFIALLVLLLGSCTRPAEEREPFATCAQFGFRVDDDAGILEARQLMHRLAIELDEEFEDEIARWGVRATIRPSSITGSKFVLLSHDGPYADRHAFKVIHLVGGVPKREDGYSRATCDEKYDRDDFTVIRDAFQARWSGGGASSPGSNAQSDNPAETPAFFQRYTDPDPRQLLRDIVALRSELKAARDKGDQAAALRISADLGERLTTARREQEARELLTKALDEARAASMSETLGWLLLNLATANQYLHRREAAAAQFPEALAIARALPAHELEHYTLQHWGRFLAESGDIADARQCFSRALELRVRLDDPRQASTRKALQALDTLEATHRLPDPGDEAGSGQSC